MEAKVDIRKLQVLNDRITQTIEALNQVRLSVHGLGHNPQQYGQQGQYGQQMFQQNNPYQQQQYTPYQQGLYGQSFGTNPQQFWGGAQGLGHTPFQQVNPQQQQQQQSYFPQWGTQQGLGHSPFGQQGQFAQSMNPYQQPYVTQGQYGQYGQYNNPIQQFGMGGLQHSPFDVINDQRILEQRATDPNRISQTFPNVFSPVGINW